MDVSDDALGLVLERVDSDVSLVRAAAVCRQWRRVIAVAAFLRRFRSLHAPAVAGYYHNRYTSKRGVVVGVRGGPVFLPSSPSTVDARHFSLNFLPNGAEDWIIEDSRGSLLLMVRGIGGIDISIGFPERLVCEPLMQSYMMVPSPPGLDNSCHLWVCKPSLIDGDGGTDKAGGCIGMPNFRVLFVLYRSHVMKAAVFAAGGESGFTSWNEKYFDYIDPRRDLINVLRHAGGSWYFYNEGRTLIILNGSTGEFSRSVLPVTENRVFNMWNNDFCVTEGRDSKPRVFTAFDGSIKIFMRLGSGDLVLEKSVLLSEATRSLPGYHPSFFRHYPMNILTRGAGFIILSPRSVGMGPFSVDLETMEVSPAEYYMRPMVYRCEHPGPPTLHALK